MATAAVHFESVWKKFRRGERHDSLRDLVPAAAKRLFRRSAPSQLDTNEFWALQDVSFDVGPGQALGIIGTNGAGKSTVLKLLTKIIRPTRGVSLVRGRVGALIEVAAGFHPDLTGRENVFLQGTIMGMKAAEIRAKLDDIVDFAGVSDFIDTPVKRYSSGMHARLGFAIASHLDPEVLLIDEVLAVGDIAFQQRCEDRMLKFLQDGVALVFVSHNLRAVTRLCQSALMLERGAVKLHGAADEVVKGYLMATSKRTTSDGGAVVLKHPELLGAAASGRVAPGAPVTLRVDVTAQRTISSLTFIYTVFRATDQLKVYHVSIAGREFGVDALQAGESVTIDFDFNVNLLRGQYSIGFRVVHTPTRTLEAEISPAAFVSVDESHSFAGIAYLNGSARVSARMSAPAEAANV